jgi:hypothetical protein
MISAISLLIVPLDPLTTTSRSPHLGANPASASALRRISANRGVLRVPAAIPGLRLDGVGIMRAPAEMHPRLFVSLLECWHGVIGSVAFDFFRGEFHWGFSQLER